MNKVYLIGNLTRDPEMRSTQSGVPVRNFSIAVNRRYRNSQTGQLETDFLNIVAWRQLAELCGRYLTKGRKVCVVGSIQTHSYEAPDGTKRNTFDIVADEVEFLSSGNQNSGAPAGEYHAPVQSAPRPQPQQAPAYTPADAGFTQVQVDDDELPF